MTTATATTTAPPSIFAPFMKQAWPYRYSGRLHVTTLVGGTPTDPNVAKAWLTSRTEAKEDMIRDEVSRIMAERGIEKDEAIAELNALKHLNGFKRDKNGLYIEGRHLKACIKEAACVAVAVEKMPARWGKTNKGIKGFVAEHIQVEEDRLYLGTSEPTGVLQRFVSTFRGTGIQYEEYVEDAEVKFTISSDYEFSDKEWAMLWLTAQEQGIGSSRSQGYGRFIVVEWKRTTRTRRLR